MEFTPNVQDIQHLNAVRVGTVGGLPRRVITSAGARLEIQDCIFKAAESCLDVDSGRVRARGNFFTTTRLLSKTVSLRNLRSGGLNSFACEDSAASTLSYGNMFSAIVPDEGQDILGQYFTAALDIRDCSHLCLDSIYIIVNAPCIAVGAHFSYNADHTPMFELSHSTVTVRSPRGQPYGLLGTEAGALSVVHCNIDVANPDDVEGHMPNGMSIWGGADIYVNSSVVMVDKGQRWFVPRENATGLITVTHTDLWSPNGQAVSQPVPPDDNPGSDSLDSGFGRGDLSWNKNAMVEAGPVFYLDPQFQQQGAWGAWDKPADVRAYYSLQSIFAMHRSGRHPVRH